jgi:imidazolonepropionase
MNTLLTNISELITLEGAVKKGGAHLEANDLSIITDAAVIKNDSEILWFGKNGSIPDSLRTSITHEINCNNQVVTSALVDSHTHLVFAGNRSHEFFMRLSGASYEEIAAKGGGITYSSSQTNKAGTDELLKLAKERIEKMYQLGLSAIEIKTGYSLTLDGELNLLEIINTLKKSFSDKLHIHRTLMSAHAVNKSFTKDQYIDEVVLKTILAASTKSLADSVDIFHEKNYFSAEDVDKIFSSAKKAKLHLRLHADELNNNQGALLASQWKCLSADHLLQTDLEGAKALAQAGVVATLLPGTAFFLGKSLPPAKMLHEAGCIIAIASDFNPGSNYQNDVFQIARMSAPSLKINPCTLWAAITMNAAKSLNLNKVGAIVKGYSSKLLLWETQKFSDLLYDWTVRPECKQI